MQASYPQAFDFCLDHEGRVYEDVEGDPGGATKWGITHTDYDEWRRENKLPTRPVKEATEDEIKQIYRDHYWLPIQGDKLPALVDFALFDSGVNVGVSRAVKWLQGVLGVTQDGVIGPVTLGNIKTYVDKHTAKTLALAIVDRRRAYYANLVVARPSLSKFLKGWNARCNDLQASIVKIATIS